MKKIILSLSLLAATLTTLHAQVKIGDNPNTINVNSMLELESTNKGFLPPRVALNNVNAVAPLTATTPAGMLIYSSGGTVADGYYYWNGTKWMAVNTASTRNNYVLVKSCADLPAAVGGIITLVTGTLYEINGTITIANEIDLNGCKMYGADGSNDKLIYTGAGELFTGSNTGNLINLTLTAATGKIFNINAGGTNKNMLVQNCNFLGCNTVGTIAGVGGSVIFLNDAYFSNTNGITFQNDNNVLLHNTLWSITNYNVYEKFIGTFNLIQILGGDRVVSSANTATATDVSGITSVNIASIKVVMFVGTGTFINGSFSNSWEVEASGINTEKDDVASGNLYLTSALVTTFSAFNTPTKVLGTTTSVNLFRVTSPSNNKLIYTGSKARRFQVVCSLSLLSLAVNKNFSFYVTKNGVILPESMQLIKLGSTIDRGSVTLSCNVPMSPNDYIEVWCENNTDATSVTVESLNLSIK